MKFQRIKNSIITKLPISDDERRVLDRRLNKFAKDPKGFLQGSYDKRSAQLIGKTPIKYRGSNDFTIVSAVYNVEKYLDDYFKSLVNQSLSFKNHIQLILVDDGSTDNSAEIIKNWQKKYPKSIKYIYKENGGQASARNLGINYIETEWVTFIDPDDFVSLNYFHKVDLFISKEKNVSLISCPFVFYFEDLNVFKDSHPLKYRFDKKDRLIQINKLNSYIQLSVNSAFFKTDNIRSNNIKFNEKIKPNFEDAKFVGDYTTRIEQESKVAFITDTSYFYRKRSDGTSTLDGAWTKPSLYSDVLSEGCLSMLEEAYNKFGYVPKHLQNTVLYHLSWYFKYIVNKDSSLNILSDNEKQVFLNLLLEIFSYIETETIMDFDLSGTWFLQRVAWLGFLKGEKPSFQTVYIENIDKEKEQILFCYFTYFDAFEHIRIGGEDIIPSFSKTKKYDFLDKTYVNERRVWVSYKNNNLQDNIEVIIDKKQSVLSLQGKKYSNGITIQKIFDRFKTKKYNSDNNIWLLMDRDTQADDNAEHLYRYIKNNYPEKNIYFALTKESYDWERLKKDGFNLLEFGSPHFEEVLRKSGKLISSHLDRYINDYFGDAFEYSKKFVFLQHGVTQNDLSAWVNSKKNLQRFITSTNDEYSAISGDNTRYNLSRKEVFLTGFPRHDQLIAGNRFDSNTILIMPTWRQSIVGEVTGGNTRALNPDFIETDYAVHWQKLLNSDELKELTQKFNYKVVFAPHLNIEPYLEVLSIPDYIRIWKSIDGSIQQLFQHSKLIITDYSSVHFEMAILNKAVLYYQFDKDSFFDTGHVFAPGYFSYEEDGFGPVVTEESKLFAELEQVLNNKGEPLEPYATRIKNTFAYRDTNNCKRVYEAIIDLDRPDTSEVSVDTIMEYAQQAMTHDAWDLALERIENALQHPVISPIQIEEIKKIKEDVIQTGYQDEPIKLANILWHEKRLSEALEQLKQVDSAELTDELLRLRVKLAILNNEFKLARDSQKLLLESYNESCTIQDWQFYTQLATI
ncbi:CDP-glycerol glycerophosphotransferase family protein [Psychrobacter sp. P11G5]|uniref:CDP-glycerol glycerophosphotransferase family protein n=1 Tax=Psychrobacter sp. P11G5 TaxID=1699624 RepID=UPI00082DD545|nr:CDP-glycerol glycerophosphotransferase family protein [Psychrobacter sp. P11G5]